MSRMEFDDSTLGYIQNTQSIILDYAISIKNLHRRDRLFDAGALGNFSLAGFEMVKRYILFSEVELSEKEILFLSLVFNKNKVLWNNLDFLPKFETEINCEIVHFKFSTLF